MWAEFGTAEHYTCHIIANYRLLSMQKNIMSPANNTINIKDRCFLCTPKLNWQEASVINRFMQTLFRCSCQGRHSASPVSISSCALHIRLSHHLSACPRAPSTNLIFGHFSFCLVAPCSTLFSHFNKYLSTAQPSSISPLLLCP